MKLLPHTSSALIVTLSLSCLSLSGHAASIAYFNDFTSSGFDNQHAGYVLNTAGGGTLSVEGILNTNTNFTASNQFSNAANTSFTMETTFHVPKAATSGTFTVGFGAFGTDRNFTSGILADWSMFDTGVLRLYNFVGGTTLASTNVDTSAETGRSVVLDTVYTLRLDVTNTAANTYDMSLGVFDAAGTTQFGTSVTANNYSPQAEPQDGFHLGLRSRIGGTENEVVFDEFAVIPEPATWLLVMVGLAGVIITRRRR